jgi:dipeptidase E
VNVLLFSNSTNPGMGYLTHAAEAIAELAAGRQVVFVPFALDDWDGYTAKVRAALPGIDVLGAHEGAADDTVLAADVVFVGGGNTFRLLHTLERYDLVDPLGERVRKGECAYIGASAGTNIAGPTIRTTNDMPIVAPRSLDALGVVPFQINPHFTDEHPSGLMAETRRERIEQFLEHSATPVIGLPEGSWLRVLGDDRSVAGQGGAVVFTRAGAVTLPPGARLEEWWGTPVFDDRLPLVANRHHRRNASPRGI